MDKTYLGQRLAQFTPGIARKPISRINLLDTNGDLLHTAGDDTGGTLEAIQPDATQAMADSILASLSGFTYRPYTGQDAVLDPAAELGDGITVAGTYSLLGHTDTSYDHLMTSGISAPATDEIAEEYPYKSPMERLIQRNIQSVRSFITKTNSELRMEVVDLLSGAETRWTATVNGFEQTVKSYGEAVDGYGDEVNGYAQQVSAFEQAASGFNLSVENLDKKVSSSLTLDENGLIVTGSGGSVTINGGQIDATSLKVNAANITGTLTIGNLPDTVALSSDIPTNTNQLTNGAGFVTSDAVTTITNNAISTLTITAEKVTSGKFEAASLALDGLLELTYGDTTYGYVGVNKTKGGPAISDAGENVFFVVTPNAAKLSYYDTNNVYASVNHIAMQFGSKAVVFNGAEFYSNSTATLGTSTYKWGQGYATASTFLTSDMNEKNSIEDLPEKYLDLFDRLRPVRFKFNDGTSDRYHVGFIAQEVEESMTAAEIDSQEFGGFGKDIHEETGQDIYMLRYAEFVGILAAKLQDVDKRVKFLEGTA